MDEKLDRLHKLTNQISDQLSFIDKLITALDTSREGVAILNSKGEYEYLNKAHEEMFGYKKGEMLGKTWEILYTEEQIKYFKENVFPIVAKEGNWHGEDIGLCKDGSTIKESIYLTSLKDGGLVCVCIKID